MVDIARNWPRRIQKRLTEEKPRLRELRDRVVDLLYPPRCLACPEPTETPMGLCGSCWREVQFLAGSVCDLCGDPVPTADGQEDRVLCEGCTADPPGWDRGRAAVAYEGVGRRVVLSLKHGDRLDLTATLARWMVGAGAAIIEPDMLIVPVPLHWRRLMARRYNQSAELARAVAHRTRNPICTDLLVRPRATSPQQGLSRTERRDNQRGAIIVNPRRAERAKETSVLLIDDVMTSGATLAAATEALRVSGAQDIHVLTLARVAQGR